MGPYFATFLIPSNKIKDVDGNEYVDYDMGFGALFAGHMHPAVREKKRILLFFIVVLLSRSRTDSLRFIVLFVCNSNMVLSMSLPLVRSFSLPSPADSPTFLLLA